MFIPSIDAKDIDTDQKVLAAISYLPSKLIANADEDFIRATSQSYWAEACNGDEAAKLCDAGVEKVVVTKETYSEVKERMGGSDRIIARGPLKDLNQQTLSDASAFLVETPSLKDVLNNQELQEFAKIMTKEPLPQGGARRVILVGYQETDEVTAECIKKLHAVGLDIVVPASHLTTELENDKREGKLNVAEVMLATATTDRPDGLLTTVVVDERNSTLGVVYSNRESVLKSLCEGQGIYWSRKRGLWPKGATSGATQTLKQISLDCDDDTLRFVVHQHGQGFCHLNTRSCFGAEFGLDALQKTLQQRMENAPSGSYTARLFSEPALLRAKIMEEAEELCDATEKEDVAWEAADLIYFALTKCVSAGVSLHDIEKNLDKKARKITRRPGNAKPNVVANLEKRAAVAAPAAPVAPVKTNGRIEMQKYTFENMAAEKRAALLLRPIIDSAEIIGRVAPIMSDVRQRGDAALVDLTAKFDRVQLQTPTIKAPFAESMMQLDPKTKEAIDQAYNNIYKFHDAQMDREPLVVETMPGVVCSRFARPIEKVGLYVPGGTAVLPSTTLMLGIPAKVAGCSDIVIATPPRADGTAVPEVMYVAHKIGATHVVLAGGAQAVAAMAYGTQTVPKVDKICGPGNQYVTAAKMAAQNDTSCLVSIDMPAGPSEVLVIADKNCNPAYVAADLLSQAEHGADSQVVLVAVDLTDKELAAIENEIHEQATKLPRVDIVRQSIPKSYSLRVPSLEEALKFSNEYAPEHLILHIDDAAKSVPNVTNAGSVFVGAYSPESCGDYASGTNHTLPTYGYSRMYSGVNTLTFVKHITSQELTADGLDRLGDTVMRLAEIEGLEAHRNAVAIRVADLRKKI